MKNRTRPAHKGNGGRSGRQTSCGCCCNERRRKLQRQISRGRGRLPCQPARKKQQNPSNGTQFSKRAHDMTCGEGGDRPRGQGTNNIVCLQNMSETWVRRKMFWDLVSAEAKGLLERQRWNCVWRCRVKCVRGWYVGNIQ